MAMVVLTLTGFSSGRHHSSRHGSGGGGGCSSSSQDHDSSSSTTGGGSYGSGSDDGSYGGSYGDSDDDSYGDGYGSSSSGGSSYTRRPTHRATSSGTAQPLEDGSARLVSCATDKRPYATVEVTNPNNRKADFQARVTFYDVEGALLLENVSAVVTVPAKGRATTQVTLGKRFLTSVDHCTTEEDAEVMP